MSLDITSFLLGLKAGGGSSGTVPPLTDEQIAQLEQYVVACQERLDEINAKWDDLELVLNQIIGIDGIVDEILGE